MLIFFIEKVKLVYYIYSLQREGQTSKVTAKEAAASRSWIEIKLIRGNRGAADFKSKFFGFFLKKNPATLRHFRVPALRSPLIGEPNPVFCFPNAVQMFSTACHPPQQP